MSTPSNLFLYIGKPVKDDYGRQVGMVTSFAVSPNGRVSAVFVEQGDGEFMRYPSEQFKIDGENIVLLPSIKLRVKTLCDEIPLIWRKDQALNELLDKNKIPSEMFNELHKNFEKIDLESMRSQLSNLLLGDIQTPTNGGENTTSNNAPSPQLPEPPVVVHVRSGVKLEPYL